MALKRTVTLRASILFPPSDLMHPCYCRSADARMRTQNALLFLIGDHQHGKAVGLMNEEKTRLKTLYCRGVCNAVCQAPTPHNKCGSCWLGTVQQFYHDMRGEDGSRVTSKLKQGTHIHQPTASPLTHAGSSSHGQLFRPYWRSSAWHRHERGKPVYKSPCTAEASPLR